MKEWLRKASYFFIRTHKKSVLGSLIAILVGGIATTVNNVYQTLKNTVDGLHILTKTVTQDDTRLAHLEDEMSDTIKQNDWIAYIQRKDGEYHTQQALNHQLFESIGKLEGAQSEDEKVLASILSQVMKEQQ